MGLEHEERAQLEMCVQIYPVPALYHTERQRMMHLKAMRDTLYMNKFTLLSKLPWGGMLL